MLSRVTGARFEAPAGEQLQIVVRSQGNGGFNDARFEYAGVVLPRQTIQGLPGCEITVLSGRERLQAMVVFTGAAGPAARYDTFEVEPTGALTDIVESVTRSQSSPLIDFVIEGVPAAVPTALSVPGPGGGPASLKPGTRGKGGPRGKARTAGKGKTRKGIKKTSGKATKKRSRSATTKPTSRRPTRKGRGR